MRRRIKSRRGFTLAECLVTLLILSMMSMTACVGISSALHDRARAITVANAQTLASTAAQAVADQVRYGQIVQAEDGAIVLMSSTYGARVRLELDGRGHLMAQPVDASGDPAGDGYALLGDKTYGELALDDLTFTPDGTGETVDSVRVGLEVTGQDASGGEERLWSLEYTVAPLNPHLVTGP